MFSGKGAIWKAFGLSLGDSLFWRFSLTIIFSGGWSGKKSHCMCQDNVGYLFTVHAIHGVPVACRIFFYHQGSSAKLKVGQKMTWRQRHAPKLCFNGELAILIHTALLIIKVGHSHMAPVWAEAGAGPCNARSIAVGAWWAIDCWNFHAIRMFKSKYK